MWHEFCVRIREEEIEKNTGYVDKRAGRRPNFGTVFIKPVVSE